MRTITLLLTLLSTSAAGDQVASGGGRSGAPGGVPVGPFSTSGPPVPIGTGAISGLVVDAVTGEPIADAVVYLALGSRPVGSQPRQFTDGKGRFAFVNLPADAGFTLSASRSGYLPGGHSREPAPGAGMGTIALTDGQWMPNARIELSRPGAISGRVTDERGEPIVGVYVRVLNLLRIQGRDEFASGPLTTTDDRGVYRLAGLAAGRYLVQVPSISGTVPDVPAALTRMPEVVLDAVPGTRLAIGRTPPPPASPDGVARAYPMTFFPAAVQPSTAGVIELKAGDDRAGVDVRLEPVPTSRIAGRVEGPPEALAQLALRLLPQGLEGLGLGGEIATAQVAADGSFLFMHVPAGAYTIDAPLQIIELTTAPMSLTSSRARYPAPAGTGGWGWSGGSIEAAPAGTHWSVTTTRGNVPAYTARQPVMVTGGSDTTVTVILRPLGSLSGRVIMEVDPAAPATASPPRVVVEPANGSPALGLFRVSYGPDGPTETFSVEGLRAGQYCVRVNASAGWIIKSIAWRGGDVTDVPFDLAATPEIADVVVTVTKLAPVATGIVRDDRGQPAPNAVVVAFPSARALWRNYGMTPLRLKTTRASSTGAYRFDTLPAGSYLLIALPAVMADAWQDPAFLAKAAAAATPLTLAWGAQQTQDLAVRVVR